MTNTGDDTDDTIVTQDGDDSISGGPGSDGISAGVGNNMIEGGQGQNTISAGSGNDFMRSYDGNDLIDAGDGLNTVDTGYGRDTIYGGVNAYSINANSGDDLLSAVAGNDTIEGQAGGDVIYGSAGADSIQIGDGKDVIYAGSGNDTIIAGGDDTGGFIGRGRGDDQISFGGYAFAGEVVGFDVSHGSDTATGWHPLADYVYLGSSSPTGATLSQIAAKIWEVRPDSGNPNDTVTLDFTFYWDSGLTETDIRRRLLDETHTRPPPRRQNQAPPALPQAHACLQSMAGNASKMLG